VSPRTDGPLRREGPCGLALSEGQCMTRAMDGTAQRTQHPLVLLCIFRDVSPIALENRRGREGEGAWTNRSRSSSVPLNDRRFVDPDLSAPCAKLNAPELERTNRVIRRQRSDTIIRSFLCPNLSDEGRAGWSCVQVAGRPETIPRPVSMVSSRELQIQEEGPRVT
jgi:hypothetical protein